MSVLIVKRFQWKEIMKLFTRRRRRCTPTSDIFMEGKPNILWDLLASSGWILGCVCVYDRNQRQQPS